MSGSMTARLIAIAMLVPFWWGLALLAVAALGDAFPRWRRPVSRLLARVGGAGAAQQTASVRRLHAA